MPGDIAEHHPGHEAKRTLAEYWNRYLYVKNRGPMEGVGGKCGTDSREDLGVREGGEVIA